MTAAPDMQKIIGRAAVMASATPDYPVTIKEQVVQRCRLIPALYAGIEEKIKSGAYIVEV